MDSENDTPQNDHENTGDAPEHQKTLEDIARKHLMIETLVTRRSDRLDFHDVSVWCVSKALDTAYRIGRERAFIENDGLQHALRENLSPYAVALMAAKLQPSYAKGKIGQKAEREVKWVAKQLVEMIGTNCYRRLCDELGV